MDIEQYLSLRDKERAGRLNAAEKQALQQWTQSATGDAWSKNIQQIEQWSGQYKSGYEPNVEAGLQRLKAQIADAKAQETPVRHLSVASRQRWLSVAAAIFVLAIGVVAIRGWQQSETKTVAVQTQTLEKKAVTLTDGTTVQLNENSILDVPKSFKNAPKRVVNLSGEAYFDVQPNLEKPFEIQTEQAIITVLGTSFNVRAYANEPTIEVEVAHGKVAFAVGTEKILLVAGEKGIYNRNTKELYQKNAPQLNAQAWRRHILKFVNTPLSEILQELERYHKVRFEVENIDVVKCRYTGNFGKTDLSKILESLKVGLKLEVKKAGMNRYIIQGGNCE